MLKSHPITKPLDYNVRKQAILLYSGTNIHVLTFVTGDDSTVTLCRLVKVNPQRRGRVHR